MADINDLRRQRANAEAVWREWGYAADKAKRKGDNGEASTARGKAIAAYNEKIRVEEQIKKLERGR
jgi:hypothetical protein